MQDHIPKLSWFMCYLTSICSHCFSDVTDADMNLLIVFSFSYFR